MTTGSKSGHVRYAVLAFALAAGAVPGRSFAVPVFTTAGEEATAGTRNDETLAEYLAGAGTVPSPAEMRSPTASPEFGEFGIDTPLASPPPKANPAPVNRSHASAGTPAIDDDLALKQLFRQVVKVHVDPTGPRLTAQDRTRRIGAQEASLGDKEFVTNAEAMVKDAMVSALEKGVVAFSLTDLGDISLTLTGERRSLIINGVEVFSLTDTDSEKSALHRQENRYAGMTTASAAASTPAMISQADSSSEHVPQMIGVLREFLTDPITIIAALGWLILWEILEGVRSSRRRRPHRRSRRAKARSAS